MRYNRKFTRGMVVSWKRRKEDIFTDGNPGPVDVRIDKFICGRDYERSLYLVHRMTDGKPGYAEASELHGL